VARVVKHTSEELTQMQADELDRLVEELVIGGRPGPEIVRHIRENWSKSAKRLGEKSAKGVPEYSRSSAGMCFIMEVMQRKGFSPEVGPDNAMWFSKEGKERPRSPWTGNIVKTTAIAAVLAMREDKP
jgi:hypothetical protein